MYVYIGVPYMNTLPNPYMYLQHGVHVSFVSKTRSDLRKRPILAHVSCVQCV